MLLNAANKAPIAMARPPLLLLWGAAAQAHSLTQLATQFSFRSFALVLAPTASPLSLFESVFHFKGVLNKGLMGVNFK